MSISKFQRILRGVILPLAALAWMGFDAITRTPIDPSALILWGFCFGFPVLLSSFGKDDEK